MEVIIIVAAVIVLLLVLGAVLSGAKCPECGTRNKKPRSKDLKNVKWKYETIKGQPDKRYKENPIIAQYDLKFTCKKCSHEFSVSKTEVVKDEKDKAVLWAAKDNPDLAKAWEDKEAAQERIGDLLGKMGYSDEELEKMDKEEKTLDQKKEWLDEMVRLKNKNKK